jgi:hypothetical protein
MIKHRPHPYSPSTMPWRVAAISPMLPACG